MPDLRAKVIDPRAPAAAKADVRSLAEMIGARRHVDIVVPRTEIRGKMRLCSRAEELEANADARRTMIEAGFPVDTGAHSALGGTIHWSLEVAVRMLAVAVRELENTERALASVDEWRECDDQQILALQTRYQDLVAELDPLGANALTDGQLAGLTAAAKKKDADLLMAFGSRLLALFAITSADQPASSETPTSTSGSSPS